MCIRLTSEGSRMSIRASVTIPVLNGASVLPSQLEALANQTFAGGFEVIVSDNGSVDGTQNIANQFATRFASLLVVDASDKRGPAHARNVGAQAARGQLLLFCDADDVVSPHWLEAMVQASGEAALLGGMGTYVTDPRRHDSSHTSSPGLPAFPFLPWVKSANMGIDRDVFFALGGFDESRLTGEDVDLCWRAQLTGHSMTFVPQAFIMYRERDTLRASMCRRYTFGRAAYFLYKDFGPDGAPQPDLKWALRGSLRVFAGVYKAPFSALQRRLLLATASGIAGRCVSVLLRRKP